MNILNAYCNITRNIRIQKISSADTSILAAIAIGYDTPASIEQATGISCTQTRKTASNLIQTGQITCNLSQQWPYTYQYTLTKKGEQTIATIMNYKTHPTNQK